MDQGTMGSANGLTYDEAVKLYGADAAEWLHRWDSGQEVYTIDMGGLGPGYELAIQRTVAEVLRMIGALGLKPETWEDNAIWRQDQEALRKASYENVVIKRLGLTGAQYGAAVSLATAFAMRGPVDIMLDLGIDKSRHIKVRKPDIS